MSVVLTFQAEDPYIVSRSKQIGTAAETAVVSYFRDHGFPGAERRALTGYLDQGDLTGLGPVCVEVKSGNSAAIASDGQVALWLAETETERENARADVGVLVLKRSGIGSANAGRWWAVVPMGTLRYLLDVNTAAAVGLGPAVRMHLSSVVELLRLAGYGTALDREQVA